jgi:thiol-disulfide isomerase/thioredoxin
MQQRDDTPYFGNSKYVTELTPKDFDPIASPNLLNKDCSIVLFYAPWCPHCHAVKDEWEKFGKTALFVDVLAFNCERYSAHLSKIKEELPELVRGFPTIIFYKNGRPSEQYNGERKVENFLKASMDMCKSK